MHCWFGSYINTTESFEFGMRFNSTPIIHQGNGDGEVNYRSLIGCEYWMNDTDQGNHKIYQQDFPGVDQVNTLDNPGPMKYIFKKAYVITKTLHQYNLIEVVFNRESDNV